MKKMTKASPKLVKPAGNNNVGGVKTLFSGRVVKGSR